MKRVSPLVLLGMLCACSGQSGSTQPAPTRSAEAAQVSAEALAAKQVSQQYFDLLHVGDFAAALKLWGDDTSTAAGGLKPFVAANTAQGRFQGRAGQATAVKVREDVRYILVESSAHVTSPKGKASDLAGVLMLKRPNRDGMPWRIWGSDIRPRRCSAGQVAQGLGCLDTAARADKANTAIGPIS